MKRITKDRSSKAKNAEEMDETNKRATRSTVKNETSPDLLVNCNDIKPIKEDALENESKIDLSNFVFKREQKPVLASTSPKKRQHIQVEYDDVSPSKVKKEENVMQSEDGKPLHWEAVLNNLREMRKNRDAPVDSMGCHKCPDESESPEVIRISFESFNLKQFKVCFLDTKISGTCFANVEQPNKGSSNTRRYDAFKRAWMYR